MASWAAAFLAWRWIGLLFLTSTRGLDAPTTMGSPVLIATGISLLFVVGWVVRRWKTHNHPLNWLTVLAGMVSIPARLIFAVLDNLRALVFPNSQELATCWLLLESLQHRKKLALQELRGISSPNVDPERIIYLLSIVGLTDTDSYSGVFYLHPKNEDASRLMRRWSHSLPRLS